MNPSPSFFRYKIVLDSDAEEFGGHKRLDHNTEFFTFPENYCGRQNSMHVSSVFLSTHSETI